MAGWFGLGRAVGQHKNEPEGELTAALQEPHTALGGAPAPETFI